MVRKIFSLIKELGKKAELVRLISTSFSCFTYLNLGQQQTENRISEAKFTLTNTREDLLIVDFRLNDLN